MKVEGIAMLPAETLNATLFTIQSLEGIDKIVPFLLEHDERREIGKARVYWDPNDYLLKYEGEIKDEEFREGWKVSIGAIAQEYNVLAHLDESSKTKHIIEVIYKADIIEISLVSEPAVPWVTLNIANKKNNKTCNMSELYVINSMSELKITNSVESDIIHKLDKYIKGEISTLRLNAVDATNLTSQFVGGIYPAPTKLISNLERFVTMGRVEGKTAVFTKVDFPVWADFTDGSTPGDNTHAVSDVTASVKYIGYKNTITDLAKAVKPFDLVSEIIRIARLMGKAKIDADIISALEADFGSTIFGDGSVTTEGAITSAMTLTPSQILRALRTLKDNGEFGDFVMVVHPKQLQDLLGNSNVLNASAYGEKVLGADGDILEIFIYGVRVIGSNFLSTGTGSGGITTYRSFVFRAGSVGLALGDEEIEIWRKGEANADVLIIKKLIATKTIDNTGVVRIITA